MSKLQTRSPRLKENLSRLLEIDIAIESCRLVPPISARDGEFDRDFNLIS
jgi:hypothetical protein